MDRRNFVKNMALLGAASYLPHSLLSASVEKRKHSTEPEMIWANLLHLSMNMWEDHSDIEWANMPSEIRNDDYVPKNSKEAQRWSRVYRPFLTFETEMWDKTLNRMAEIGMNMVVIDLGDGVKYESHPEIAVKNAWSVEKLEAELCKIRKLGLEPIPKLNFATTHSAWMGKYSRMISSKRYYEVCRNLISEVIELFNYPRFFHIGMDEEIFGMLHRHQYAVVRQGDLWWNDLYFYINQIERKGGRSWLWSDYGWHYPDVFFKKMPKSVLQSNWYYGDTFDLKELKKPYYERLQMYSDLEKNGYDQIPTGSNWSNDVNMEGTVRYCKDIISPKHLCGFMMAPWRATLNICSEVHMLAIDQVEKSKIIFQGKN